MVVMSSPVLFGQPASARPVSEVASVKLNTTNGSVDVVPRRSGDLVMMHNTQVYSMIFYAYHLTASFQIINYPIFPKVGGGIRSMREPAAMLTRTRFI
jgi:hypothetical protein